MRDDDGSGLDSQERRAFYDVLGSDIWSISEDKMAEMTLFPKLNTRKTLNRQRTIVQSSSVPFALMHNPSFLHLGQ
jgi:hypothetical protein